MYRYLALLLVMAPMLAIAEWASPELAGIGANRAQRRTDLTYLCVALLYVPLVGVGISTGCADLDRIGLFREELSGTTSSVLILGGFVFCDLAAYWVHRALHSVRQLWSLHCIHHSSTSLTWSSGFRFHFLDVVLEQAVPVITVVALGFPASSLAVYLSVVTVVNLFAHCNVSIPAPWLEKIVVTPGYHRTHHQLDHQSTNFAVVLPVFDAIFSTQSPRSGRTATAGRQFGTVGGVPILGYWNQLAWGIGLGSRRRLQRINSKPMENESPLAA